MLQLVEVLAFSHLVDFVALKLLMLGLSAAACEGQTSKSSQPGGQFQSRWNQEAATCDEVLVVFENFVELEPSENSAVSPPSPHRLAFHAVGQRSRSSLFHSPPGAQILISLYF